MWLPYFRGNKFLTGFYVQTLLGAVVLPAALAIGKILGYSEFDPLEVKGNHLADISTRNTALKGTTSNETSVIVQGNISPK